MLRRIFGPNSNEAKGEWRKLHNGEHHNSYSSPYIMRQIKSRRMRWVRHVACMGEDRKVYKVLVEKPKGNSPPRRPRCTWKDEIKMDLRKTGWEGVEWIHMAQDRNQQWVLVP
jgi:hypothetical protein